MSVDGQKSCELCTIDSSDVLAKRLKMPCLSPASRSPNQFRKSGLQKLGLEFSPSPLGVCVSSRFQEGVSSQDDWTRGPAREAFRRKKKVKRVWPWPAGE